MKSIFENIVDALSKVHGTGRVVSVKYTSRPRTTKKSRATKEPAHFAKVTKTKTYIFRPGNFVGGKLDESGTPKGPEGFERVRGEVEGDDIVPVFRSIKRDELAIGIPPAKGFENSVSVVKVDGRKVEGDELQALRENFLDRHNPDKAEPTWQMLLSSRIEIVKADGEKIVA